METKKAHKNYQAFAEKCKPKYFEHDLQIQNYNNY
jgi:hypothetical protein